MKPLILNMDTALPQASICLSQDGVCLDIFKNESQKDHAAWLHPAIEQMLRKNELGLKDLDGIAVTAGPGSYTGLRISMAAAKGFCFILKKPLLLINTLETMAYSAIQAIHAGNDTLYCPMIDARRMEVFTAVYNADLNVLVPMAAVVLNEYFDDSLPSGKKVIVFGSGSLKYQGRHEVLPGIATDASHLAELATRAFMEKKFTRLDEAVPLYGKAFFTPPVK